MELLPQKKLQQDDWYVEGIRDGQKVAIEAIYRNYFPRIQQFVLQNSGNLEDAKDIFQDALLAIFHKAQERDFFLSSRFGTYLFAICKNIWLKELRRRNIQNVKRRVEGLWSENMAFDEMLARIDRYKIYLRQFRQLGEKCQQLLELYLQGESMQSIARQLGFASVTYVRKRKFKCKEQLISRIERDEEFQKLNHND